MSSRATVAARFPHQCNRPNRFKKLFVLLAVLVLAAAIDRSAHAQTLTVLHTFMGEESQDGSQPNNGVVMDAAGNLYGTTYLGGLNGAPGDSCYTFEDDGGCGTVFKLARHGSGFVYSTLYKFQALPDGNYALGVVIGPDGTLYGATNGGGIVNFRGCLVSDRLRDRFSAAAFAHLLPHGAMPLGRNHRAFLYRHER